MKSRYFFFAGSIIFSILIIGLLVNGFTNRSEAIVEIPDAEGEPAIQIEEVTLDGNSYMGGNIIYLSVSVETNEPYDEVNYYLNGTWIGASYGNGEKTEVTFRAYPDGGEGSVTGVTYQVRVDVWREHKNDGALTFFTQDSSLKEITIYTPIQTTTPDGDQDIDFVSGFAAINKHTYDPVSGFMSFDYFVSATHIDDGPDVGLVTEHKASFFDLGIEDRKPPANGIISRDNNFWSDPDTSHGTMLFGGNTGEDYEGEAYVRIIAIAGGLQDDYHLTNTMWCTHR